MQNKKEFSGIFISNFNLQNFTNYIDNDVGFPLIETELAPFGQVTNILLGAKNETKHDFGFIWTQPHAGFESFSKLMNGQMVSLSTILEEVDVFAEAVKKYSSFVKYLFIASWVLPAYYKGMGLLDLRNDYGISNCLMRMNLHLADRFSDKNNIFLLNSQKWIESAGEEAFSSKLWYLSKTPFVNVVFKEAMKDLKSALKTVTGNSKKLIILDLDDTLWGGIVGEVGWENLKLGGHDFAGESFVEFQTALKALKNRGILLAIVSKNEEVTALEAITKHPEMILKKEDFIAWEINWGDKSKNILNLLRKVNLGAQSVVFIDDNPVERARVRESIPDIFVPEWPKDSMHYVKTLHQLNCFDIAARTDEDLNRTELYQAESERSKLRSSLNSIDDWLVSLKTVVTIEKLSNANIQRAAQLLNKTNQMNLTTRRLSEAELSLWAKQEEHELWTFRVSDKFSDSGLTGIISIHIKDDTAQIVDFLLSCRVMGRKIEETMVRVVVRFCISNGIKKLIAEYVPTNKNKPCFDFWKYKSGFIFNEEQNSFLWDFSNVFPDIPQIEIINNA